MVTEARARKQRLMRAWGAYRELHFSGLARKTRSEYNGVMRHALAALPAVTTLAVMRWHRGLLARYSPSYANQALYLLRAVAKRAELVTGDRQLTAIVHQVTPTREVPVLLSAPPPDLVARALNLCRNPAERLFVRFAGVAGLRRGEILGLRASDYDKGTRLLRVVRQRRSDKRKNRRPHVVRITAELHTDLEWTVTHYDELRARTGWFRGSSSSAGCLFPWSLRRTEGLLGRLRAGLPPGYLPPRRGWHAFRHWGATQLAREGASVWTVMRWLGDSSSSMAARYVDLFGAGDDSVARLEERVRNM